MSVQSSEMASPQEKQDAPTKDAYVTITNYQTPQTSARKRRATATLLIFILLTFAFVYSLVMVERSIRRNGCTPGDSPRSRFRLPCETGRHYPLTTVADWQSLYD